MCPWNRNLRVDRTLAAGSAVLALLLLPGCQPPRANLSGSVSYDGKPLPSGQIKVIASDGRVYSAAIRTDGTYQIGSLPVGTARFAVMCFDQQRADDWAATIAESKGGGGGQLAEPTDVSLIPMRYADFSQSGLSYPLAAGPNAFPIRLEPER